MREGSITYQVSGELELQPRGDTPPQRFCLTLGCVDWGPVSDEKEDPSALTRRHPGNGILSDPFTDHVRHDLKDYLFLMLAVVFLLFLFRTLSRSRDAVCRRDTQDKTEDSFKGTDPLEPNRDEGTVLQASSGMTCSGEGQRRYDGTSRRQGDEAPRSPKSVGVALVRPRIHVEMIELR